MVCSADERANERWNTATVAQKGQENRQYFLRKPKRDPKFWRRQEESPAFTGDYRKWMARTTAQYVLYKYLRLDDVCKLLGGHPAWRHAKVPNVSLI